MEHGSYFGEAGQCLLQLQSNLTMFVALPDGILRDSVLIILVQPTPPYS